MREEHGRYVIGERYTVCAQEEDVVPQREAQKLRDPDIHCESSYAGMIRTCER